MKKSMDTIQFESRYELSDLISALETFLEEHPKAEEGKSVERLRDLLDAMCMEW